MASHKHTKSEAVTNKDMMKSFKVMARAVREQVAATTLMAQQMANGNGNGNSNDDSNGRGEVDYEYMKFVEFRKANTPSFQGTFDPNTADEWIKEMKKIFSILTCTKEQKVSFAAYMLKANAEF